MTGWSMKNDRELIRLARANLTLDQIAAKFNNAPTAIIKIAKRLGIILKPGAKLKKKP
jgi:hypothetical protein